ncbi:unnamed protein product [Parajaminaea phylloscopi]
MPTVDAERRASSVPPGSRNRHSPLEPRGASLPPATGLPRNRPVQSQGPIIFAGTHESSNSLRSSVEDPDRVPGISASQRVVDIAAPGASREQLAEALPVHNIVLHDVDPREADSEADLENGQTIRSGVDPLNRPATSTATYERHLRVRKPAQLNPYTIEMATYKRRLERNDWQDAVVTDRNWRRGVRTERERQASHEVAGSDEEASMAASQVAGTRRRTKHTGRSSRQSITPDETSTSQTLQDKRLARDDDDRSSVPPRALSSQNKAVSAEVKTPRRLYSPPPQDAMLFTLSRSSSPGDETGRLRPARAVMSSSSENESGIDSPFGPNRKRRRHHLRTFSSSDEDPREADTLHPVADDAVRSCSGSSSASDDSVDYHRIFRQLKRMMPVGMARKHLRDLKNMRKGKAYHSDGHESASPEPAAHPARPQRSRSSNHQGHDDVGTETVDLRPGEARSRLNKAAENHDARYDLVGDSEESDEGVGEATSDSDGATLSAISSQRAHRPRRTLPMGRRGHTPDDVDRMLSRSIMRIRGRVCTALDGSRPRKDTGFARPVGTSAVLRSPSPPSRHLSPQTTALDEEHYLVDAPASTHRALKEARRKLPGRRASYSRSRWINLEGDALLFNDDAGSSRECDEGDTSRTDEEGPHTCRLRSPSLRETERSKQRRHLAHPVFNGIRPASRDTSRAERTYRRSGTARVRSAVAHPSPKSVEPGNGSRNKRAATVRGEGTIAGERRHSKQPSGPDHDVTTPERNVRDVSGSKIQREADSWADIINLRLDFGIRPLPLGISFSHTSRIGRGKLHELLQLASDSQRCPAHRQAKPRAQLRMFRVDFLEWDDLSKDIDALPALFDTVFQECDTVARHFSAHEPSSSKHTLMTDARFVQWQEGVNELFQHLADAMAYLAGAFSTQHALTFHSALRRQLSELLARTRARDSEPHFQRGSPWPPMMLYMLWYDVEFLWRALTYTHYGDVFFGGPGQFAQDLAGHFSEACQELMVQLLFYGLHRTMAPVKEACLAAKSTSRSQDDAPMIIDDPSAEIWVNLCHLLETDSQHRSRGFWTLFEPAIQRWLKSLPPRRPILAAESVWFSVFALMALSQFSASNGSSLSSPKLTSCWSLPAFAIEIVRLRFDEEVERAMPDLAIRRRDQYIRATIQRCANLLTLWHWSGDAASPIISRVFDLFNKFKLADLPSEHDHDFPPFLRHFDSRFLRDDARRETTAYHTFLKFLALAASSLDKTSASSQDARRRISRLFSRVCPVRVMRFDSASPPTAHERSSLFNHYSVAMLHLFLAPEVCTQRLRQIKSFLEFRGADAQSQVTCLRAMMYAAVIHRHYDLDIHPVAQWFGNIATTLVDECERQATVLRRQARGNGLQQEFEQSRTLLIAALRALRCIINQSNLRGDKSSEDVALAAAGAPINFPHPALLHQSWTSGVLATETGIDPEVGMEVLRCLQSFLSQRSAVLKHHTSQNAPPCRNHRTTASAIETESIAHRHESPVETAQEQQEAPVSSTTDDCKCARCGSRLRDRTFAFEIASHILPALFTLISNMFHPDRDIDGICPSLGMYPMKVTCSSIQNPHRQAQAQRLLEQAARRHFLETAIDCWAGCAHVLVENGLRDWSYYIVFGNECWKRIGNVAARRDAGLRFVHNVALLDGQQAFTAHPAEFLQVWFQGLAARSLSIQADFTRAIVGLTQGKLSWFEAVAAAEPMPQTASDREQIRAQHPTMADLQAFWRHRELFVRQIVAAMRRDYEVPLSGTSSPGRRTHCMDVHTRSIPHSSLRSLIFACLSSFLCTVRDNLEQIRAEFSAGLTDTAAFDLNLGEADSVPIKCDKNDLAYIQFCARALHTLREDAGLEILRGVTIDMTRIQSLLDTFRRTSERL